MQEQKACQNIKYYDISGIFFFFEEIFFLKKLAGITLYAAFHTIRTCWLRILVL